MNTSIVRELTVRYGKKTTVPEKLSSPDEVARFFRRLHIHEETQEHFYVLCLDNKNQAIAWRCVSVGTVSETIVHPREVYQTAMLANASSIIVAHNHPSDTVKPSREDIETTKRLHEAGKILGIALLDHVIVTTDNYVSLKAEGYV